MRRAWESSKSFISNLYCIIGLIFGTFWRRDDADKKDITATGIVETKTKCIPLAGTKDQKTDVVNGKRIWKSWKMREVSTITEHGFIYIPLPT